MRMYVVELRYTGGGVRSGSSTAGTDAIVHFGSVGRLWGLFERSKAT